MAEVEGVLDAERGGGGEREEGLLAALLQEGGGLQQGQPLPGVNCNHVLTETEDLGVEIEKVSKQLNYRKERGKKWNVYLKGSRMVQISAP